MQRKRSILGWLGAVVGLLAACAAMAAVVVQGGHQARYLEARARWERTSPASYRLAVATSSTCTLESEVRAGQPVRVLRQDQCLQPVRTVADLFRLIERGQVSERCFFAGCACRIDVTTFARYDPIYGYPVSISIRYERAANWWTPGFWQYIAARGHLPGCERSSEAPVIESVSITPLQ